MGKGGGGNFIGNTFTQAGNLLGDVTGSNAAARAAQGAAQAQRDAALRNQDQAAQQLAFAKESQQKAIDASSSVEELIQYQKALEQQAQSVARNEKIIAAMDPAILKLGEQLANVAGGGSTGMTNARKYQREQLLASLRSQLGPGAETSSAGIMALSAFDRETAGMQTQELGSLSQIFGNMAGQQSGFGQNNVSGTAGIGQLFGNVAARKVGAITGGQSLVNQAGSNLLQAGNQVTQAAGADFVGAQLRGQAQMSLINQGIKAGAMAYGAGAFGGGAGAAKGAAAIPSTGQSYTDFGTYT